MGISDVLTERGLIFFFLPLLLLLTNGSIVAIRLIMMSDPDSFQLISHGLTKNGVSELLRVVSFVHSLGSMPISWMSKSRKPVCHLLHFLHLFCCMLCGGTPTSPSRGQNKASSYFKIRYELIVQARIKPESIDTSSQIISGTLAGTHS